MKFRYLRDPLFLVCFVLYFVNRFLIKRLVPGGFFHDSFNDLICIPFWVPIMLFLMRKVGLRRGDAPPQVDEILLPLVMWSLLFEIYLPHVRYFEHLAVSDYMDILWYTIGALTASVIWDITYRDRRRADCKPLTSNRVQ
jgi:hypothetical protein